MGNTRIVGAIAFLLAGCSGAANPKEGETGFSIEADGFSFENFGSTYDAAQLNSRSMARMFGAARVCATVDDPCVLTPNAQAWMDSANDSMSAGHCEGFAILSQLFFLGDLAPTDFGAPTVRELKIDDNFKLQRELAYWFATQLIPSVSENKTLMPDAVIPFLKDYLKDGPSDLYRIGMVQKDAKGFGAAHSLTPIGFVQGEAPNIYYIRVYDNNFPVEERQIRLDLDADTWDYTGLTSVGTIEFHGGKANKNPLYFASTKSRLGELPCPFCSDDVLNVTVKGAAPLVTDSNGETGFKDGELVIAPNATVSPGFAACTKTGATVMVSSANGASPATVSLAPSAEPTQSVNIQGGSIGTVAVSGDLATMAAAQIQADGKSVSIQSMGESTTVSFQVGNTTVTVTVSGNAQDVTVTRDPATGALTIETQGAAGAEVTVELEDKQTGLSTSYDVNNGTSATSTTSIALPTSGWTGTEPPAATSQVGGSSSTLAGSHCGNNIKDSGETDIDCGGMCGSCSAGQGCLVAGDCESGACNINSKTCVVPSADGIKNGLETDIDCGGLTSDGTPRCDNGKACTASYDCKEFCSFNVCVAPLNVYGSVSPAMSNVVLQLTPSGNLNDVNAPQVATSGTAGLFSFLGTRIINTWAVSVVSAPNGYTCTVTSQGQRISGNRVAGIQVVCTSPASTPCQNGTRDGSETDTDCGGATCNNLGLFCAVGKLCSVDADCGAPNNASICVTGTCRKTFNLSGTVSTSVPVTLQLTPGGTLSATSASPRQLAVTPASTTFAFLNTRVSGAYAISEVAQAGVACQFTNGSGTATADVSNIAISCTSCSNGTKEGTETDVDCGGACADQALRCAGGKICLVNNDCLSNSCNAISHTCASVTTGTWSSVGQTFGSTGLAYTEGSATSATDAWAAGGEDVANYDGATWTVIAKPFAGFPVESLFATSIGGAPHVWAGSNTSLLSEWDGTTWTARPVMMLATNETFLAIHGDAAGQIAVGTNGTIARTNVSGDFAYEFFMFPPPTSATLNAVYKVDDNTAWAVGDGGTIVMQGDPMWSAQTSNTTANLRAVWAISSTDAWAAGDGGVVLHWDGNTWSTVASGTTSNIFALFGDATNSVWLAGAGGVIRLWNGSAWVSETSNTTQNLSAVFGAVGMRWAVGANQTFVSRN